jgi:predicted metal-dependent phosphoesterase TrpH
MIDLHCHSHYSDGLLSPAALIDKAMQLGLSYFALTDHDTVAGYSGSRAAIRDSGLQLISGIELSVHWKRYDIHIIGLNIDVYNKALLCVIQQQSDRRIQRARAIGTALEGCGIPQAYEKACVIAGHGHIGRAHYAQLLLQLGYVPHIKAAFTRYLGTGKVAYVPSCWINLQDAVSAIHQAGGQAVIAHPLKYRLTRTKLLTLIQEFKLAGGVGIEVVSGDMVQQDIESMAKLCSQSGLLASSGSDFHGEGLSRVPLGKQKPLPSSCTPIWQTW